MLGTDRRAISASQPGGAGRRQLKHRTLAGMEAVLKSSIQIERGRAENVASSSRAAQQPARRQRAGVHWAAPRWSAEFWSPLGAWRSAMLSNSRLQRPCARAQHHSRAPVGAGR